MAQYIEQPVGRRREHRSPQRLALEWATFFDAVMEKRVTHDPDPVLARHAANLALISGPSGLRPDLDVVRGRPDRRDPRRDDCLRHRYPDSVGGLLGVSAVTGT
jgi:hypothetical protein